MIKRVVIKNREIYRVSLAGEIPVRMYLPTGDFRTIEADADCLMLGKTLDSTGLMKEFDRDNINVEPYNLVAPDAKEAPEAAARFAQTMRHLFKGNVLFLSEAGIFASPASDGDKASGGRIAKKMEKVLVASDAASGEEEPAEEKNEEIPLEEVESDQADRLESALTKELLRVVKDEDPEPDTEEDESMKTLETDFLAPDESMKALETKEALAPKGKKGRKRSRKKNKE